MFDTTDRVNYYRDARTQGPAETNPTVYLEDDTEVELPTSWQVCPVCDGEGKHVNPSIDCGGISSERFAEDPEFAEDYFSGTYDVPCNHCDGRSTVRGVNWEALSPVVKAAYEQQLQDEANDRAEHLAELRAGA